MPLTLLAEGSRRAFAFADEVDELLLKDYQQRRLRSSDGDEISGAPRRITTIDIGELLFVNSTCN